MNARAPTIMPLGSPEVSLGLVGGKARSLARLVAAGLPVPEGFLITTAAYEEFIEGNRLREAILEIIGELQSGSGSVDAASVRIGSLLQSAALPDGLADSICRAYDQLGDDAAKVAVRSSATAEDLAELSFAGQQDTFLNVWRSDQLLDAVRRCWASLWSSRAIEYRIRMSVDQRTVAMGVIVQRMVQADASGVLFTANPASGERSEIVVNASYGLGEAIVAGEVTPDSYRVDRDTLQLKETVIGAKQLMIVASGAQGTTRQSVSETRRGMSSLPAEILSDLVRLSLRTEQLFDGVPQDIEWAVADGKCWLLQSRPITNLPLAPLQDVRWDPPEEGTKLIRRQVVENMPEPLSPLFAELYLSVGLEDAIDRMMEDWNIKIDLDDLVVRPYFVTVNGYAYCRASYRSIRRLIWTLPWILYWYVTTIPRLLKSVVPAWRDHGLPEYLAKVEDWNGVDRSSAPDHQLLEGIRALAIADANYWFDVTMVLAAAKVTDGLLNRYLNSWLVRSPYNSGNFLRGFPSKLVEAQLELEAIARGVRQDERLSELVTSTPAAQLLAKLQKDAAGQALRGEIDQYLGRYGHQIYTLDFVEPTQIEEPLPVLLTLQELVKNEGYDTAERQAELVRKRELQIGETLDSLGPFRRRLLRTFLGWAQTFGPHREESLFYLGSAWPTLRRLALELGRRLVGRGALRSAGDVFFLVSSELAQACEAQQQQQAASGFARLATGRRELRERQKKLHPPGMVPEKSKFKIGPIDFSAFETQKRNADDSDTLDGFAVSPGKISGEATVILSPSDFATMKPNTILVCSTTTPAWTPLLAQASGLATDIGGILAHGSIVAREYGIPAVMGTGNVTQRVTSGQQITVDGDAGTVTLHR